MDKHLLRELQQYIEEHLKQSFSKSIQQKNVSFQTELKQAREGIKDNNKKAPAKKLPHKELISKDNILEADIKTAHKQIDIDQKLERKRIADSPVSYMQGFSIPKERLEGKENKVSTRDCTIGPEELKAFIRKKKSEDTFSTKLLKYIDRTGLPDSEIYKRAGIDRRHFSKIRCDKNYKPKKSTAIAFCLALRLDTRETEELLGLSGYTLTNSETGDLVVRFCIERGIYDLMEVNDALDYFGVKAIGAIG